MNKRIFLGLASLAMAASVLSSQAVAAPVDISSLPSAVKLVDGGSLTFGDKFKNNQKSNFFNDVFTFDVKQVSDLSIVLTSQSTSALNGLNLTSFGLYGSAGGSQLMGGTQELTGIRDKWTLSFANLAVGSYYLKVGGDIVSNSGATFTANGALMPVISAVPEPETYAMFIAGMGLMVLSLRRRQKSV